MQQTRRMRLNIVGTSNVSSVKGANRLQTFVIAAAFVNSEKAYTCILEGLREAIWSSEGLYELPSVFVIDNETALRYTIDAVFLKAITFSATGICGMPWRRSWQLEQLNQQNTSSVVV